MAFQGVESSTRFLKPSFFIFFPAKFSTNRALPLQRRAGHTRGEPRNSRGGGRGGSRGNGAHLSRPTEPPLRPTKGKIQQKRRKKRKKIKRNIFSPLQVIFRIHFTSFSAASLPPHLRLARPLCTGLILPRFPPKLLLPFSPLTHTPPTPRRRFQISSLSPHSSPSAPSGHAVLRTRGKVRAVPAVPPHFPLLFRSIWQLLKSRKSLFFQLYPDWGG